MGKAIIKKLVVFALTVTMCLTQLPTTVFASNGANTVVQVSANSSKIVVNVDGVDISSGAQVVCLDANAYYATDTMVGMSNKTSNSGEVVADLDSKKVEFARYDANGKDRLFSKFYIVENGNLVAGPYYASQIESVRSFAPFEAVSKKGLTLEDASTIVDAIDMGVSNTVINMNLSEFVIANEDVNGIPVDNSGNSSYIPFVSNGETFYFNSGYISMQDQLISAYSKAGINVNLVLISWAKTYTKTYPSSLMYVDVEDNSQTMAFNTSGDGLKYWVATMEFLADRYSKDVNTGIVNKFIVGNEVDYAYDWYLLQPNKDANGKYQRVEFNTFMEEYARTLRLANLAVKKYNSDAKVMISLTHNWAVNSYDSYNNSGNSFRINSYAPKAMLDWLNTYEKARGDYNWGAAVHPYPIGTVASLPTVNDPACTGKGEPDPVTGDWKTSPWVTAANLELYQLYFERPENMYNGTEMRSVSITEACICSEKKEDVSNSKYLTSTYEQAASIAQFYYRAAHVDCIEEIAYFQLHDQDAYRLGLVEKDGTKKAAYDVWKYIDTNKSFTYSNLYLNHLKKSDWLDVMKTVKSDFNWDAKWNKDNIIKRNIVSAEGVKRVAGATRYQTSYQIAKNMKEVTGGNKYDTVIIASGTGFADALAGSYLAAKKGAPILMSNGKNGADIQAFIRENVNAGGMVYLLGGIKALPGVVVSNLEGYQIKRLAGDNRYATNLEILKEAGVTNEEIIVATGNGFADSLSASASGKPILLVNKGLTADQKAYLSTVSSSQYYIIGGVSAVSAATEAELKTYGSVERLGGANRYQTSAMVASEFFPNATCAIVAYGRNFPDGLCGGPLAYSLSAPLILTENGKEADAIAYTSIRSIKDGAVLGGAGLVSDKTVRNIFGLDSKTEITIY